jgi:7,8-dihydropterin-6-yl-methyl-4-(beta-D-ribofuranosyl)aminobenzene 5'-phosphate synthase
MAARTMGLRAVERVQITVLMDNTVDVLMAGSDVVRRLRLTPDRFQRPQPRAEHGFAALIEVGEDREKGTVLLDTGSTDVGLLHNLDVIGIDARDIEAIVLSHGHADHVMGLQALVGRLGGRKLPLVLHPDARLERRLMSADGVAVDLSPPIVEKLPSEGVEAMEEASPSTLAGDRVLVSGEVARTTSFEHGLSNHEAKRGGRWEPDPLIRDDQCLIMNRRGKGLVIVTGCGHAGIVNIARHAQALTGVQEIHAVVGGFHLSGPASATVVPPTIAALEELRPNYVMPAHCTGWQATHQIARALPDAFIASAVGTALTF